MSDSNSNRFPAKKYHKKPKRSTGKSRKTLAGNASDDVKSLSSHHHQSADDDLSFRYSWSHTSGQTGAPTDSSVGSGGVPGCTGIDSQVKISLDTLSKSETMALKRKLLNQLDRVRSLVKRMETEQNRFGGYINNINNNHHTELEVNSEVDLSCYPDLQPSTRTTIAKPQERNQKRNQSNKKSDIKKLNSGGIGLGKGSPLFKSCNNLLTKLLKDRFGWIFKQPVDVKKLKLFDYFDIIKNPMDLGTVKTRLNKNWYKSPQEFAEDVRLTFSNAMLYNPEEQDTHIIAKRLLNTFEEKWVAIEAEHNLNTTLEEEASDDEEDDDVDVDYPESVEYRGWERFEPMAAIHVDPDSRTSSSIKDKDVTPEDKAWLVERLERLPMDVLESVGEIMLNRNPDLLTMDGEIELDIESVDPETHWEVDNFVRNYTKNMITQNDSPETNLTSAVVDGATPRTAEAGNIASGASPVQMETRPQVIDGKGSDTSDTSSSNSDNSSSDSESSSSDSDSDSTSNDCSADTDSIISI